MLFNFTNIKCAVCNSCLFFDRMDTEKENEDRIITTAYYSPCGLCLALKQPEEQSC